MPKITMPASLPAVGAALIVLAAVGARADETVPAPAPAAAKQTATLTFYVAGVECPACVYAVNDAIRRLDGVAEVEEGQANEHFSNVTFDTRTITAHQVAQAVREAYSLHGSPYLARLRIRVTDYAKDGNAARVARLFEKWKEVVRIESADAAKGELVIQFLPLEPGAETTAEPAATRSGPRGWRHEELLSSLTRAAPEGLGLRVEFVAETY